MAVDIIARAMAAEASSGSKDVDYGSVTNKPQINGITLEGNKTTSDLGIGEIVELKGTEENPIELANIGEPGIYKISGNTKVLTTSEIGNLGTPIILEVAKSNDAISQHYWEGNSAFNMKVRVTISGIPFTENFHELSQNGDIENYSSINAFSLITSLTLSRYLGRGYMGKVLLTDLKTTDKNSLINAINELVDTKQDKLTAGSGITIENNVISASGGTVTVLNGTEEEPIILNNYVSEPGIYIVNGKATWTQGIVRTIQTQNTTNGIAVATKDASSSKASGFFITKKDQKMSTIQFFDDRSILSSVVYLNYYDEIGGIGDYSRYSFITGQAAINYCGDKANLETTDKTSLVAAINEVAKGGSSGAFPIIDATGETEIDLDNYLDDGTWIIKGHNVKQIKEYGSTSEQETDWAILDIKTHKWLSNGYVYQILRFPMMAFNNGGFQRHLSYGIRQIKPTIESRFVNYAIPVSMTNYYDSFPTDGYQQVLSAIGSYNMYTALMSYLTNNINNKPHLSDLNTIDKTSLVNAINEINAKIPSGTSKTTNGTFVINLTEDASNGTYTADRTYDEINEAYENSLYIVVCLNNCLLPLLNAEKATDGNLGITFGYTNIQSGGNLVTTRAIHYLYAGGEEKWEEADVNKEFLPITGGTMQGILNLYAEPTEDIQASNKSYVDKKIFNITFTKEETAGLIADKEITDVIDAISRKVLITGTLENKIYYFNYYINGEVRLVNCDNNVISTISYSNDAWNLSTVTLLDTKGNTKLTGNLDVNNNQLKNVQKIHIDGEAPLYLGSTVETTGTKGTRLTGTTEGGVAFIKADSQGTYVPVSVGEPTSNSHSATKKYVDEKLGNAQTELSTIYFANSTGDNNTWIEKDKLQPLLQEAYDKGYHDIIIRTTQGTKYIMCSGSDLQDIDGSSLQFVSLVHPTGSSTKPNRMFIGYFYANTIKVVDGVVTIEGTTGKSPVSYIDLMKENALVEMQGYDATKTQVLKNINGQFTWVDEN